MRVYIKHSDFDTKIEFYIIDERDGKRYVAKPVVLEFEEILEGAYNPISGTLTFRNHDAKEFIRALIEEFEEKGYIQSVEIVKGKLEAQTYHLEDMRKLVFNNLEEKK